MRNPFRTVQEIVHFTGIYVEPDEYNDNARRRIQEHSLIENRFYTLFFLALSKRRNSEPWAAKMSTQVHEVRNTKHGPWVVRFSIVDEQFNELDPPHELDATFENGYWYNKRRFNVVGARLLDGFFVEYDDGWTEADDDLLAIVPKDQTPAPVRELLGV